MAAAMLAQEGSVYLLDRIQATINVGAALYTAPNPLLETHNYGVITQPTFAGYAEQFVSLPSASLDGDGKASILSAEFTFTRTVTGTPETVLGVFIFDDDVERALWSDVFRDPDTGDPSPVVFEIAGEKVRYRSRLTLHRCLTITV